MRKHNPENERIKRDYLHWMRDAEGRSEATIDQAAAALIRYEGDTGYKPFRSFNREQVMAFKRRLIEVDSPTTGKPLSKATVCGT